MRGAGKYVWYNQLSPASLAAANEYLIAVGDVLSVRVLNHEDMTTRVRVRADGRIAVPIIGEVVAAGRKPNALRGEIEGRLKDFIVLPTVTLNVEEQAPPGKIVVLGEVVKPGLIPVDSPTLSLAEALALCGGSPITRPATASSSCGRRPSSSVFDSRGTPSRVTTRATLGHFRFAGVI